MVIAGARIVIGLIFIGFLGVVDMAMGQDGLDIGQYYTAPGLYDVPSVYTVQQAPSVNVTVNNNISSRIFPDQSYVLDVPRSGYVYGRRPYGSPVYPSGYFLQRYPQTTWFKFPIE